MTLGFIIFGRKQREGDAGPAFPAGCRNCGNYVYFHAFAYRNWGHVFWIPLLPLTKKRFLTCPVCMMSVQLNKSEFTEAKELTDSVRAFERGELSESSLEAEVRAFQKDSIVQSDERIEPAVGHVDAVEHGAIEAGAGTTAGR